MLNRKVFLLSVLIIVLLIFGVSGCVFNNEVSENPSIEDEIEEPKTLEESEEIVEGEVIEEEYSSKEGVFPGDRAPEFTLLDREGNEINLSDLRGKIVYMNFWATWRGPSTYEMPFIQEAYEKYQDKDVVVLAVNVLAAEEIEMKEINSYIDEKGYTIPILYDVDGSTMKQYKVGGFPTTFIIDKEGIIADFVSGSMEREVIMDKINKVLEKY